MDTNRPGIVAVAETILATAARLHDQRTSGQHGLFGESDAGGAAIKPLATARWSIAERMEQEKEAFGFYFSAHPVDRHRLLARMHGARNFAALGELPIADGQRTGATMAALVEDARWRTSARGRRYMMATLSDPTGQFVATCFDDAVAADLEDAAKAGGCGLLTVELDRRPGEETPRVTVKRIQPFETLATSARVAIELRVTDGAADWMNSSSGIASSAWRSRTSRLPVAQVVSRVKAIAATSSGNHPPSATFVAFEAK